jgi:hypothetical protein
MSLLAVNGFQGLAVKERLAALERMPQGCSPDGFKRRRKRVLEEIARFLLRDTAMTVRYAELPNETPDPGIDNYDKAATHLIDMAAASTELYYAGLTSLFAREFFLTLIHDKHFRYIGRHAFPGFGEYLFDAYSEFYMTTWVGLFPQEPSLDGEQPPDFAKELGRPAYDRLRQLVKQVVDCGPLSSAKHYRLLHVYAVSRFIVGGKARFVQTNAMYEDVWMPWYCGQFTNSIVWPQAGQRNLDLRQPTDIELFVGLARDIQATISSCVDPGRPIIAVARQRAHKMIAAYYEIDEWLPLIGGQSLRERADRFFDQRGILVDT